MVSPLYYTGDSFRYILKKINGAEFYGQLLDLPDTSRVSNFLTARRYLRVRPNSSIIAGDVIVADGIKFIVAEHGTGFHFGPIYKHWKLFEVDKVASWSPKTLAQDAITGTKKIVRTPSATQLYLSTQPKNSIEDTLHIPQQTYVCICDKPVARDDVIDGKLVTKVDKVLGVYLLELKEE